MKAYTDAVIARLDDKLHYYFTGFVHDMREEDSRLKRRLDNHERRNERLERARL